MLTPHPDLLRTLLAALPEKFLAGVASDLPRIYKESYEAMHNDPLLGEAEAAYVTPHYRRGILENTLRKWASQSNLDASVEPNPKKTSEYTVVRAGAFLLTASYSTERWSRVRYAQFRTNYTALNSILSQQLLFPEPKNDDAAPIYCVMVHGPSIGDRSTPGFFDFHFPNPAGDDYLASFSLDELLAASQALKPPPQQDGAQPKFKQKKDKDADESGSAGP